MGVLRKAFKDVMHQTNYKILRGDKVMVTAGKDAGQVGTVLKVIRDTKFPRVVVEGLNLVGRRIRARETAAHAGGQRGGGSGSGRPARPTELPRPLPPALLRCRTSGTSSAARTARAAL